MGFLIMADFGILTEIARYNLADRPECIATYAVERFIYRPTQNSIREVIFGVSDVLKATLVDTTNGPRISGDIVSVGSDKYYITSERKKTTGPTNVFPINAVKLSDGSITTRHLTLIIISYTFAGIQRGTSLGLMATFGREDDTFGTFGVRETSQTPPLDDIGGASTLYDILLPAIGGGTVADFERTNAFEFAKPFNRYPTKDRNDFIRLVARQTTGPYVLRVVGGKAYNDFRPIIPPPEGGFLTYGPLFTNDPVTVLDQFRHGLYLGSPWYAIEDTNNFYIFGFHDHNTIAANRKWFYERISKAGWGNDIFEFAVADFGQNQLTPPDLPTYTTDPPRCQDAFAFHEPTGFIYFAIGANATRRIYKSQKWPITLNDSYNLDTTGASGAITGIFLEPPFIYVSKLGGAQGNQIIKLYDPDLDTKRKARRSGGEIWALIPELKDYL
jgi:hypothetical protein